MIDFGEYCQELVISNQLEMMLESEELFMELVTEIVTKAGNYQVKSKANVVLFDILLDDENFATVLRKYRNLFYMMNHRYHDVGKPNELAMKYTMFAVDRFFDKYPNAVDLTEHFVTVVWLK